MTLIPVFLLIIAAACLLYGMWGDRGRSSKAEYRRSSGSWNGKIPRSLLQAVKGDRALAKRLVENARLRYPGKSDRWYIEKVIYDIERDGAGTSFGKR